ncbi:MAG: stage V sporulation protein AC [Ruminococcaceae bacterium]|nr:stage V sporulation protein AC [Oscillospiraceae bacterium]
MDKKTYARFADAHAPHSPILKNCILAFLIGGIICTLGEGLGTLYTELLHLEKETAGTLTSVSLILLSVVLTALGIYDRIAKHAGAGTLVPITGFANAVSSPAIDSHSEGLVLGVGAKIFTVSGPVILYGVLAGAVYGTVLWFLGLFGI